MPILAVVLLASLFAAGCRSPEATRTRGGGPGADPGNRPAAVKMHEGSRQFWRTRVMIPSESVPLEPARHAQRFSQP